MTSEIEKLERTMIALEAQRAILGDAIVETTLESLREKLTTLRSAPEPSVDGTEDTQQRKIITVLFADITGLSEWPDVEDLRDSISLPWELNPQRVKVGLESGAQLALDAVLDELTG